jgi:hypothetical protein
MTLLRVIFVSELEPTGALRLEARNATVPFSAKSAIIASF